MNVPRPLGKLLHEDLREQQGTTLWGPPFAQTVYEIVNQAARGRRSGGRGEGELIPPPSLSQSLLLSKLKCS